jgi:DNA-directed RNA polymerase specialized sigma24 family protein
MEDAKDITQDIFFRAWKKREQIRMIESLKDYLYAIARNCIKDYYRNKARVGFLVEKYK